MMDFSVTDILAAQQQADAAIGNLGRMATRAGIEAEKSDRHVDVLREELARANILNDVLRREIQRLKDERRGPRFTRTWTYMMKRIESLRHECDTLKYFIDASQRNK